MKRIFTLILTSIFFFICCSVTVNANEARDSLNITPEEKQLLKVGSEDFVLRLYNGAFMWYFDLKEPIDAMITEPISLEESYAINSNGIISHKRIVPNEYVGSISGEQVIESWCQFGEYAISPEQVFGSSVNVHEVYCLNGEYSHDGVYIYYVTDQGDYVLFRESLFYGNEYLFPIADFYDFAKVVMEERIKNRYLDGGVVSIEALLDLEAYKFQPKLSTVALLHIHVGSAVILSIGIICFTIWFRKKRRNKLA